MNVTHDEHASQSSLEPFRLPVASAPWFDLLVEAGSVGVVFLVLALVIAASVAR